MHLLVCYVCLGFLLILPITTAHPRNPEENIPNYPTNSSPPISTTAKELLDTSAEDIFKTTEKVRDFPTVVGSFVYSSREELYLESENSTEQLLLNDSTTEPSLPVARNLGYVCTDRICIRKCCPKGFFMDQSKGCVETELHNITDWEPDLRTIEESKLELIYGFEGPPNEPKYGNYVCGIHESFEFHLKDDGEVHHKARGDSFNYSFYCIENFFDKGKYDVKSAICYEPATKSEFSKIASKFHMAGMIISTIFLLAILILHMMSYSRKDLQTKCTISSCVNLFFGFILATVNMSPVVKTIQTDNCVALGVSVQFFFLSFYFWLNIMCYEITRIFRGTMRMKSLKDLTRSEKRYFAYCIYSWGCPLLICIVTLFMQYLPEDYFSETVRPYIIRPHIAEGRCWFKESAGSVYAYYYGIEVFLHSINACLMGHTTYLLFRDKLRCLCCKREGWSSTQLRTHCSTNYLQMFKQQIKIYLMYLLIWIINSISLIDSHADFWRITDILVSLQGAFLFFIMIQARNYTLLTQAYQKFSYITKEISTKVNGTTTHNEVSRL